MADTDNNELVAPFLRWAKFWGGGSSLLAIAYVLAFVYLKTYLAVFGFQVELTNLSAIDLLLTHRYFAGQHFFVLSGAMQAHLFYEFHLKGVRKHKFTSGFAVVAPVVVLLVFYALSVWSEEAMPKGFNIRAQGLWKAFLLGWLAGGVCYWLLRLACKELTSIRNATPIIFGVLAIGFVVYTYRLYSHSVARDRMLRNDFQFLEKIETDGSTFAGPYAVVHIDSRALYLHCESGNRVILRDKLRSFRVVDPKKFPTLRATSSNRRGGAIQRK